MGTTIQVQDRSRPRASASNGIAAFWFAVVLAGQAIALQLIDAGPRLHYQHYKLTGRSTFEDVLLVLVLVQVILVAVHLRTRRRLIGVLDQSPLFQALAGRVDRACFCRRPPPYPNIRSSSAAELAFAGALQLLNLATVVLAVWALPAQALVVITHWATRLLGPANDTTAVPSDHGWIGFRVAHRTVGHYQSASLLSLFSYQRHPHVTDEVAYLLHARFLAQGALTLPAPPVPVAFEFYLWVHGWAVGMP